MNVSGRRTAVRFGADVWAADFREADFWGARGVALGVAERVPALVDVDRVEGPGFRFATGFELTDFAAGFEAPDFEAPDFDVGDFDGVPVGLDSPAGRRRCSVTRSRRPFGAEKVRRLQMIPTAVDAYLDHIAAVLARFRAQPGKFGLGGDRPAAGRHPGAEDEPNDLEASLSAHRARCLGGDRTAVGNPHEFPLRIADVGLGEFPRAELPQDATTRQAVVDAARGGSWPPCGLWVEKIHIHKLPAPLAPELSPTAPAQVGTFSFARSGV